MSFLMNIFFKKEEEPKPPPEPAKAPNIFGGLSVKTSIVPKQPLRPISKLPETTKEPIKDSNKDLSKEKNPFYGDPFEDLLNETPIQHFPQPDKKNDHNSIEFLLDLTMGDSKITQNPTPVVIKKNKEIKSEVSSELRKANVGKAAERVQEDSGNFFAGISTKQAAKPPSVIKVERPEIFQEKNETVAKKTEKGGKESEKNRKKEKNRTPKKSKGKRNHKNRSSSSEKSKSSSPSPQPLIETLHLSTQVQSIDLLKIDPAAFPSHSQDFQKGFKEDLQTLAQEDLQKFAKEELKKLVDEDLNRLAQEDLQRVAQEELEKQTQMIIEEQKRIEQASDPNFIHSSIISQITSFHAFLAKLTSDQQTLLDVQQNYLSDLQEMQKTQKDLENQASDAGNQEDFELAVKYSDERDTLLLKIEFTQKDLESKSEEFLQIELLKSEIHEKILQLYLDLTQTLNSLDTNCESEAQTHISILESLETDLKSFEQSSAKIIETKTGEIEFISESYSSKKAEVEEKLAKKTEPVKEKKQETEKQLKSVSDEIEELQKVLQEKILIKDGLLAELNLIESELLDIPQEFSEDFKDLHIAEELIEIETQELRTSTLETEKKKQNQLLEIENKKKALEKVKEKQNSVKEIRESVQKDLENANKTVESRRKAVDSIQEAKKSLKLAQQALETNEKSLHQTGNDRIKLEELLLENKKRAEEVKTRLPVLENEKKLAMTQKQFKEAAKLNTELKDLTQEFSDVSVRVGSLKNELELKVQSEEKLKEEMVRLKDEVCKLQENLEEFRKTLLV